MTSTVEMVELLSLAKAAKALHVNERTAKRILDSIPETQRTEGGQYRVPVWALVKWQKNQGRPNRGAASREVMESGLGGQDGLAGDGPSTDSVASLDATARGVGTNAAGAGGGG